MIISISGLPGAGKSMAAKMLADDLGWPVYGMGNLRRQAAAKQNLTLAEYNQLGETDPETDLAVDRYQSELGKTQDNFIIEGRTSWHFIPQSLKIFLRVEPSIGAERIWRQLSRDGNQRNEGNNLQTVADVLAANQARLASDRKRYQQYFGIDVYDEANYDFVLDTSRLTPEEALVKLKEFIAKRS